MAGPSKKDIEPYEHKGEKRVTNPPVGLVTPNMDKPTGKKTYAYDPHLDPQLVWACKAEHTSFEVPTVLADEKDGWSKLAKNLRGELDPELVEAFRGPVSLPFEPGEHRRAVIKIIDDRGIESLKILEIG